MSHFLYTNVSDTDIYKIELTPDPENWKKFKTGCNCREQNNKKITCYKCQLGCCENAQEKSCVCLYSYECKTHNFSECHGSHS
jgi:hypothetical protein